MSDLPPGVVLTKNDSLLFLRNGHHSIVGFNFWHLLGNGPISQIVFNQFKELCIQKFPHFDFLKPKLPFFEFYYSQCQSNQESNFIFDQDVSIVNSFVESQRVSSFFRQNLFAQYLTKIQALEDSIVVCVGSEKDKTKSLPYTIDHDLRGKLTIKELMTLFSSNQIKRVVTFDTFIAHLAILHKIHVDLFVKSKKNLEFVKDRFVPFFNCQSSVINYY